MFSKFSIQTKFIILISLLLAGVLSLQLYFTNSVHQDIIDEIDNITQNFNLTTDAYFFGDIHDMDLKESDLLRELDGIEQKFEFLADDTSYVFSYSDTISDSGLRVFDLDSKKFNKVLREAEEKILELKIHKRIPQGLKSVSRGEPLDIIAEENEFEHIIIHSLDSSDKTGKPVVKSVPGKFSRAKKQYRQAKKHIIKSSAEESFSFIIPDFSKPAAPKYLEYTYNPDDLNQVIRKMRNRNALITLLLFGLSIIGVVLIARKFIKPIRSLNTSFEKVVQGDLTVSVSPESGDEIGELTRSFNKMVSELKKNKEKEDLLRRKERLASLGQLAAGVAHEIKNPLNAINLTIEHLQDKFVDSKDTKAEDYILSIQNEIKRLDKTVNNFLNYVRSEKLEKSSTNINELIEEILQLYERELVEADIRVEKEMTSDFVLNIDRERFKTALVNIFLNSVQAISGPGEIRITTNGLTKEILITDTGCGIAEKDIQNIFDLFYTTKSSGTGLGLPTAYKIIREHQGEITISSNEGEGTRVVIQLT